MEMIVGVAKLLMPINNSQDAAVPHFGKWGQGGFEARRI